MLKKITIAAALTLASTAVFAENQIGFMLIPNAELELSDTNSELNDEGDGFGIYGKFGVADSAFVTVEYTSVEYDEGSGTIAGQPVVRTRSADFEQIRVGYGGNFELSNPQLSTLLHIEFINFDIADESETGVGIHAGLNFAASPKFDIHGQVGYVTVDNLDGPELKFGVDFQANEQFSLFADYRISLLGDDDFDFEPSDFRLGAAIHF